MDSFISELARIADIDPPMVPRLAPWLTIVRLGDDRIDLRATSFWFPLRHPLFAQAFEVVLPLLDGNHTATSIVKDVQPQVDAVIAEFLLKMLTAAGCLVESDALVTKPEFATLSPGSVFISRLSTQPDLVLNALSSAHVTVAGGGELATLTADFLIDSGVTHVERITLSQLRDNPASVVVSGVTLAVVCLDSQDFSIFDQVNEASLQTGVPWLRSMLDGPDGQVGPAVIPHQSACYRCFDSRWRSHVAEPNSYDAYRETSPAVSGGLLSSFTACVASHTAMEAVRLISRATAPSTVGHFFEFHVANPIPVGHVVLRLPRCPACKASVIARTPWGRPPAELDPGS